MACADAGWALVVLVVRFSAGCLFSAAWAVLVARGSSWPSPWAAMWQRG